jgi:hypothetical protein
MSDDSIIKLKIDGEVFEVDFDDLELGEAGEIEDLCDSSVQEIDWLSARGMQGLVWAVMHRKNPQFTIADAGRIKFSAIQDPDAPAENRDGAAKGKAKRPTKTT